MDKTSTKKEIELLLTSLYSKSDYDVMFVRASKDQELFLLMWEIINEMDEKDSWRIMWILDHATKKDNTFIFDILDELYVKVMNTNNESFLRIGMNLIMRCPINEDFAGEMLDKCVVWMHETKKKMSTQVMGLEFFYRVCLLYPEMKPELLAHMDDISARNPASAGLRVRLRDIRKKLES